MTTQRIKAGGEARRSPAGRGGATLLEVLIAILVMGIGVISVATLFPIAVLRSTQATRLTVGTIHRFNAEELLTIYPQLYVDPDRDTDTDEHILQHYIVDPVGMVIGQQALKATSGDPMNGFPLMQRVGSTDTAFNPQNLQRYNIPVLTGVNPLGADGQPGRAGVDDDNDGTTDNASELGLPGSDEEAWVDRLCTSPDSWVEVYEGEAGALTDTSVVVSGLAAFMTGSGTTLSSSPPMRLVIFNRDETKTAVRPVLSVTGNTATWSEDDDGDGVLDAGEDDNLNGRLDVAERLPGDFGTLGRVKLEMQERRYTWLLTVRGAASNVAGSPPYLYDIDVVVFFARYLSPEDETVYATTFTQGQYVATLSYAGLARPPLKKGGYLFDSYHGYWYQAANIADDASSSTLTVTLRSPARAGSASPIGAMVMRNIVDVYPLGFRSWSPE